MTEPYSTQKLVHHPKALQALRERRHQNPTQIHFMPSLACPHKCAWCSYGHRDKSDGPEQFGWKNMQLMSDEYMPVEKMRECVGDWKAMGVKAVEVTGGGEPLVYPHIDEFFELAAEWGVDLGLVTNGTALTADRAILFGGTNWKWARVSIDAGDVETYVQTRRIHKSQWLLAWRAVERLAGQKTHDEHRVGVGYVVDAGNYKGVYEGCRLALEHGADNIRISLAFTPQAIDRFPRGAVEEACRQAQKAKHDFPKLQVNDLVSERALNIVSERQDYEHCPIKDVLCVVGGDQRVYTCCTLAFNPRGLIGEIKTQSFRQLWESSAQFLREHDARKVCPIPCLYERRNKRALRLMKMTPEEVAEIASKDSAAHVNFI